MRYFIAAMILIAGVAHAELNAIGKARGLDPNRVDKKTTEVMSKMDDTIYTNCVIWQQMSYDDTGKYYDLSASETDGSAVANKRAAFTNIVGGAYDFDGWDDMMDLDTKVANVNSLAVGTISVWFNIANEGVQRGFFACSDKTDNSSDLSIYKNTSNRFTFLVRENGSTQLSMYVTGFGDSAWHLMTITVAAGGNVFYMDGIKQSPTYAKGNASTSKFFVDVANQDVLRIGGNEDSGGDQWWMKGLLDDVRVFNRALTSNEVFNLLYEDEPTTADGGKR